jgi:hypothetical protein
MLKPDALPPVQYDLIQLGGGLDLATPAFNLAPGVLRDAINFAARPLGGYYRIAGYERINGMPKPSNAAVTVLQATWSGVRPLVGETATIGTLSGVVCGVDYNYLALTKTTGTVPGAGPTNIVVSATVRGTSTGNFGAVAPKLAAQLKAAAANQYRADITPVPGSGPILGCIILNDVIYAFRNNASGTEAKLYKSSGAGWVNVPVPGTLLPNGRYEMVVANFTAGPTSTKIYGCDGVNPPFQFDGTTYTAITTTGMSFPPEHIYAFKGHLFLAYKTSVIHSALGNPLDYQIINGAGEIGTSDNVTGFLVQPGTGDGGALAIYGRNTIYMLYGSSSADWKFVTFGVGVGGIPFTMQNLADSYTLDDRGIISMKSSLNYGNFDTGSLTYNIATVLSAHRALASASSVNRQYSQYRVFFSDGYGIFCTIANSESVGHGIVQYPDPVLCAWDGEWADGSPVSIFGTSSGHVMQNDVGTSFDGALINGYFVTNINISKQLRIHKRFRKCVLEVQGEHYTEFSVGYNFDWASTDIAQHLFSSTGVALSGTSAWDSFYWDNFYWDGRTISPSYLELNGSGENIQLIVSTNSDFVAEFSVNSAILHYTLRRGKR